MIQVKSFFAYNELRNFSYLLYEDTTGEAWVIDPYEASPVIKYIKENGLTLQGILNTHSHFDHIRGNAPLIQAFHSEVKKMTNNQRIPLNEQYELETLDTPGHTPDHQVYVLKEQGKVRAIFSGDTLFNSGVGNCKNGGNVDQLYHTTMKLLHLLPDEALLYPGHDYAESNLEFAQDLESENSKIQEFLKETRATDVADRRVMKLGEEKKVNPFLRLQSEELRRNLQKGMNVLDEPSVLERHLFHQLRTLRDKW